MHLVAI